jgi:hypothetical protein
MDRYFFLRAAFFFVPFLAAFFFAAFFFAISDHLLEALTSPCEATLHGTTSLRPWCGPTNGLQALEESTLHGRVSLEARLMPRRRAASGPAP